MKMKRTLSMALALCFMFGSAAVLPEGTFTQSTSITASAETQIVNNITISTHSTVYIGEIVVDGQSKMQYAYSDDISSDAIPALKDSLINNEIGIDKIDIATNTASEGLKVSSSYQDKMNDDWKSSEKVAKKYFWGLLNEYSTESSNMYDIDKQYKEYVEINHAEHTVGVGSFINKDLMTKNILTTLSSHLTERSSTVTPWASIIKETYEVYKEATSVVYTKTIVKTVPVTLTKVEAKPATCTEDGNIEYWTYDSRYFKDSKGRNEITKDDIVDKAHHTFEDKWTVTKMATCTEAGSEERACTICGEKETREIPTTEHTFGEWEQTVAPTCTQKGSESRKCSVCDEVETREIDALGHKFEDSWTVTKEATCTQAGSEERVCTVCGGNEEGGKETREIKAKGHKFGKEWTVVRTASAGMPSLKVKYCENCKGEEEGGKLEKEGSSVLEKERVFGDNRFKTSLAIADQFKNANNGKAFENIIVASGADFADALSASYLAKVKNAPILLVANKATIVINDTIEYIKKNAAAGANVYLVGGSSVVSNSMITDLKKLGFKAKRLAGSNRYDTNIEVLKEAGVTNEKIIIASGMDYADALSASAVGLPILLVAGKGKSLTPNQKAYLQSLKDVKVEKGAAPLSKAYIIGGTGAVSAGILKQAKEIFAAAYRVAGSNRYETSVKVAETFFKKETPKTVAVAYGMNYPDGLCGGPLAIAYKCPLILTVNQKPDAAVAYAKSIKAASVVAFGGKQLISVETMNKILGK